MIKFDLKTFSMMACLIFLTGCTPAVNTQQLDIGVSQKESFSKVLNEMEKDTSSQNEMWYWLDLGRMYQIQKEYQKSIGAFNKAEAILDEYENRAEISLRNIGSGIGSTLFSKGAETYYAKGYERTLMHTLNGINYAMLGNFEGATVEMRKMEKRQEFWLKESEAKIIEARDKKSDLRGNPDTESIPSGYSMAKLLEDDEVRNMVNNYQDSFSYSLSSIISKISKDEDYSQISKKRAIALSSNAEILFNEPPKTADLVDVNIIVLSGQAPSQTIEKLRVPFPYSGYLILDLPSLSQPKKDVSSVVVSTSSTQLNAIRLLRADKMAYKTLKDEFPMELTKSLVRATSKAVTSKQMQDKTGGLGGLATMIIMDVTSTVMEKSYRNWEMLPNSGFISKVSAKRGEIVSIRIGGREELVVIPENTKNGSLILVSFLTNNNIGIDNVQY
jgi:hypothetical protein